MPAKPRKAGAPPTTVRGTTPPSNPQPPPSPPRGDARKISDDFGGGGIDPQKWHLIVTGTEVDADVRNGRFEVTIGAGAVAGGRYNVIDGHLGTQCRFPGDYDARVDFELLGWPLANGVHVALAAFFANARVERQSQRDGEIYSSWIPPRGSEALTNDAKGSLRMTRTDGMVTTYYLAGERWVRIDSARAAGEAVIGPSAGSTNPEFGKARVEVAFDNLVVQGDAINCPAS